VSDDEKKVTLPDLRQAAAKFLLSQFEGKRTTGAPPSDETVALIGAALHLTNQL
jgi:hypothetical protein